MKDQALWGNSECNSQIPVSVYEVALTEESQAESLLLLFQVTPERLAEDEGIFQPADVQTCVHQDQARTSLQPHAS